MKKQNSPSKPQRVLVEQESGYNVLISTPAWLSLAKKAGKNEVPLSVLEQVYARGLIESKPHPKNSPEQQAFNRVESFLHQGKAYELDEDLVLETPKVPNGSKHMSIIKSAIKGHEERNKPQQTDDSQQVNELFNRGLLGAIERKVKTGYWTRSGVAKARKKAVWEKSHKSIEQEAQELAAKQERKEKIKSLAGQLRGKTQGSQGSIQPRQTKTPEQKSQERYAQKNKEAEEKASTQSWVNKHGGRAAAKAIIAGEKHGIIKPRKVAFLKAAVANRYDEIQKRANRIKQSQSEHNPQAVSQGYEKEARKSAEQRGRTKFRLQKLQKDLR